MVGPGTRTEERIAGITAHYDAVGSVLSPEVSSARLTISVVICTWNRSESLRRTLESLECMFVPAQAACELIIVDNNSSDDTAAVVRSFAETSHCKVRYVFESRKGTSYARNRGIHEARGEVIAFIDDDMIVDREWLVHVVEETSQNSSIGIYFGQTRTLRPGQFRIAVKEGSERKIYSFPCNPGEPGSSNNMILRRSALAMAGEFDTQLGPGTLCRAAEDIDLTYRVLRSGAMVCYCPDILAYHDHARSTADDLRSLRFNYAIGAGGFYCKHLIRRDLFALKSCCWEIKAFVRVLFERGEVVPVFLHLTGMLVGFWLRLESEAKAMLTEPRSAQ